MDCLRFICIKMLNRLLFHTHIALNLYFISYLDREYDTIQGRLWKTLLHRGTVNKRPSKHSRSMTDIPSIYNIMLKRAVHV